MARVRGTIPPPFHPLKSKAKRSEGRKDDSVVLRVKVAGAKPHPNPYGNNHGEQYSFKLLANQDLYRALRPEGDAQGDYDFLERWMKVNPREQRLDGPVTRDIERTWNEYPEEFFRVNRGLVLSAEGVTWDNDTGVAEIVFTNPHKHGVVDGGHTLRKIVEDLIPSPYPSPTDDAEDAADENDEGDDEDGDEDQRTPEPDRYVSCEVWVGLNLDQVARLSQGRNNSRTVPPYGLMAMKGNFDALEAAIRKRNSAYADRVAFKPNQHMENPPDQFRPISVLEILQLLIAMDIAHSSAEDHPIDAYKNRGRLPDYFAPKVDAEGKPLTDKYGEPLNPKSRLDEYEKMFPLIGDFLALYDKLRLVVPEAYKPRHWSRVLARKGKVNRKRVESLYYLDHTGETKVSASPTAVFFPMFSAFRAYLKKEGNRYAWADGESPLSWPEEEFSQVCQRLAMKIAKAAKKASSLHDIGRDETVWDSCYSALNVALLENGRKKKGN